MRLVLIKYASLFLFCCTVQAGAQLHITVRVHNAAASESQVRAAEDEAAWLFRRAGVQTLWVACSPEVRQLASDDACAESDDPMAFTIRIMPSVAAPFDSNALGYAMPFAGNGNHAAVFYPQIMATVAGAGSLDVSDLLGYAIAHELAHLIFHSTRHGGGLMRADWRGEELAMAGQRRLVFDAHDVAQLAQQLHGRELESVRRQFAVQAHTSRGLIPDLSARFAAMP